MSHRTAAVLQQTVQENSSPRITCCWSHRALLAPGSRCGRCCFSRCWSAKHRRCTAAAAGDDPHPSTLQSSEACRGVHLLCKRATLYASTFCVLLLQPQLQTSRVVDCSSFYSSRLPASSIFSVLCSMQVQVLAVETVSAPAVLRCKLLVLFVRASELNKQPGS